MTTETSHRDEDPVVVALRVAARRLTGTPRIRTMHQTFADIVAAAVAAVPHSDAAGVSVTGEGADALRSSTGEMAATLGRLQVELHEGPCISVIEDPPRDGIEVAHDLAGVDACRWPRFAPYAVEAGYRAILSVEVPTEGGTRAALNLYSRRPDVFDAQTRRIAGLFAIQAATVLYGSQQAGHLQRAVDSRDVIGQAKGILMERFTIDADAAFRMLVRSSQDTNVKVVDIARWLRDEVTRSGHTTGRTRRAGRPHTIAGRTTRGG